MPPRIHSSHFLPLLNAFKHTLPPSLPSRSPCRKQSKFPIGPRRKPQYSRFNRAQQVKQLWYTSPTFRFRVGIACACLTGFIAYNLERVPISGRLRFNCVRASWEEDVAGNLYGAVMQEYRGRILPSSHPDSKLVQKVMKRLIPASGLEGQEWEIYVINDKKTMNAFVIPGGKVFVFNGVLPLCNGEDGLAVVLGHEIAHTFAHHTGEKLSRGVLAFPFIIAISFIFDISGWWVQMATEYVYERPGSRAQESEADYIGLLMMAQSCYDPEAAVGLWERMEQQEKFAPPQFLSTHPSHYNRMGKIKEWLPQAQEKRSESECGSVMQYASDFKKAFVRESDDLW